ncbi:MAG TPA: YihA family ribosome biogenesis GTP-binding protein, partial [Candidatus Hydrogenedentes bacterium]|nr:YihA family ribosome biogenesis GTP-binding protein [Candidatus Hydrogenedentota bacterium]
MRSVQASFVCSALEPEDFPRDGRPEFAFVGRSNVGKSSLLNALLRRKELARTSGKPGKTQTINFFSVDNGCYFVDLPGYGYARVSRAVKEEWGRRMLHYLRNRDALRMVALLVDARHEPADSDLHILEILGQSEKPTLIVATKFDKVKRSLRGKHLRVIREGLGLDEDALVIPFSSVTSDGVREVWRVI